MPRRDDTERALRNALTVGDLRRMLEDLPDEAPVFFSCNYGDYSNTEQALPIAELIEATSADLEDTAYSQSGVEFVNPDERDEKDYDDETGEESDGPDGTQEEAYRIVILQSN